jgi:hypothetical protein
MGSMVSNSVVQPVPGGSTTSGSGGFFGRLIEQALNSGILQQVNQPTQDSGITSLPINTQPVNQISSPTTPVRGYNQVRDPRLNRTAMRPMFNTSRYSSQINNLLGKLLPDSAPNTPQLRPTTDPMGRSYSDPRYYKTGGRVGYEYGGLGFQANNQFPQNFNQPQQMTPNMPTGQQSPQGLGGIMQQLPQMNFSPIMQNMQRRQQLQPQMTYAARGGLMNLRGHEMDYRASGGFVPIGKKERADDVPARLSKNEFVFTANAVRNAGGGDIRKGAKRMYNLMHQLEAKK